jgi:hypothetical protein
LVIHVDNKLRSYSYHPTLQASTIDVHPKHIQSTRPATLPKRERRRLIQLSEPSPRWATGLDIFDLRKRPPRERITLVNNRLPYRRSEKDRVALEFLEAVRALA